MRDPYEILGVTRSASAADIKSAFRKLAKKLHPDANKHDPKAATRFAEINAAYEIVGDKDKRKAFDGGEIDAEGKPRFQGFEGFGQQPGAGAGGRGSGFESFTWGSEGAGAPGGLAGALAELWRLPGCPALEMSCSRRAALAVDAGGGGVHFRAGSAPLRTIIAVALPSRWRKPPKA